MTEIAVFLIVMVATRIAIWRLGIRRFRRIMRRRLGVFSIR
jgi:hypothetical protein